MPDIADVDSVRFSNEQARVEGDKLAQAYYKGVLLDDAWTGLGGGQTALDALRTQVSDVSKRIARAYFFGIELNRIWVAHGSDALVPNTADAVIDGAPADGRPAVTGAKVNTLVNRTTEYLNWLGGKGFDGAGAEDFAELNTVLQVSFIASADISVAQAGSIINRVDELRAEYEASTNAKLNTILQIAVNTGEI